MTTPLTPNQEAILRSVRTGAPYPCHSSYDLADCEALAAAGELRETTSREDNCRVFVLAKALPFRFRGKRLDWQDIEGSALMHGRINLASAIRQGVQAMNEDGQCVVTVGVADTSFVRETVKACGYAIEEVGE